MLSKRISYADRRACQRERQARHTRKDPDRRYYRMIDRTRNTAYWIKRELGLI